MSNPKTKPFVMFPKEVLFHEDLSIHSKLFFSSLLHWDRGSGRGCFASRQTMSKMTGLSLYHIRESIKELVELGLIREVRRGLGKTNLIHIVIDDEDNQDDPSKTISSQEIESVDDFSSYNVSNETSINRFDDDTDFDSDLEDERQGTESDSLTTSVEEVKSPYQEEETILRGVRGRVRDTEYPLLPGASVLETNESEIVVFIPSDFVRQTITTDQLSLIENVVGKKVILSGSDRKEKTKNKSS